MYFPGLDAYFQLVKDLQGSTRMRWGATCVHQHNAWSGWTHVYWDLPAARELLTTVSSQGELDACLRAEREAKRRRRERAGARSICGMLLTFKHHLFCTAFHSCPQYYPDKLAMFDGMDNIINQASLKEQEELQICIISRCKERAGGHRAPDVARALPAFALLLCRPTPSAIF